MNSRSTNVSHIAIGISACLLGHKVRYDGGHKHDHLITGTLGHIFRFVAVCPEVECGLPTPREAMRLEGDPAIPSLVTIESRIDLTAQIQDYCNNKIVALGKEQLSGFILKSNSPSCGPDNVRVFNGISVHGGSGIFAANIAKQFPLLPITDECRLHDITTRNNFIEHVRSYHQARKNASHK